MFLTPRTLTYQRHEQQPEVPGKLCFRVHFRLFQENSGIFLKCSLHKALTSQNVCGNITKTSSGWCPDYRSQSSKLSILTSLWNSVSM